METSPVTGCSGGVVSCRSQTDRRYKQSLSRANVINNQYADISTRVSSTPLISASDHMVPV